MKILNSTYELVEIDSLTAHPENPRRGDIEAVAQSIDQNGFYGALIAQVSTRRILLGNHRWKAAKKRGALFIAVLWVDCDDDRARRILLADQWKSINRSPGVAAPSKRKLLAPVQLLERQRDYTGGARRCNRSARLRKTR